MLFLPSLYPILLSPQAASQLCAAGLAGRLRAGWPTAGDPQMTFESCPCQFTELPFLISVTASKSRQIIDGGNKEGGRAKGQGACGRLRWLSLPALDVRGGLPTSL